MIRKEYMKVTNNLSMRHITRAYKQFNDNRDKVLSTIKDQISVNNSKSKPKMHDSKASSDVSPSAILTNRGEIKVLNSGQKTSPTPSFTALLEEVQKSRLKKVRKMDDTMRKSVSGKASTMEIVESIHSSEVALQEATTVLNKFIESWNKILGTPL